MTDMEAKIATGLATAQNNGVEAAAVVAEAHAARIGSAAHEIAASIRLLKTSAHEILEENTATPEAAE